MEDLISDLENKTIYLSDQIVQLQSQILNYQKIIEEKDNKLKDLIYENAKLKAKLQNLDYSASPPITLNQPTTPIGLSAPKTTTYYASDGDFAMTKRQCPNCGAAGFAIKEVEDRTKLLSYVPRRIYAKKRVCTKCRYEF